jgi:hypothetical protein
MPLEIKGGVIAPSKMTCERCPLFRDCQFDQPRMGGFKGTRPHYIGYRKIADRTELNGANEDITTCFNFVEAVQKRMRVGRGLREEGKDGDIIKVIAQEGEWIHNHYVNVGVNQRGEIVKPQPHLIEAFKKAGRKVAPDHLSPAVTWDDVKLSIQVPNFEEVQARVTGRSQSILAQELEEQGAEDSAEDQAWEELQARKAAGR